MSSTPRLAFAAVATAFLIGGVVLATLSGSSDGDAPTDECLALWNEDALARSDGAHAYQDHGYSDTLVARINRDSEIVTDADGPPTADARCAVVFATPQVQFEPDFGVRVRVGTRWMGLVQADGVPVERIPEIQADVTAPNATLLPDGRLAAG